MVQTDSKVNTIIRFLTDMGYRVSPDYFYDDEGKLQLQVYTPDGEMIGHGAGKRLPFGVILDVLSETSLFEILYDMARRHERNSSEVLT